MQVLSLKHLFSNADKKKLAEYKPRLQKQLKYINNIISTLVLMNSFKVNNRSRLLLMDSFCNFTKLIFFMFWSL